VSVGWATQVGRGLKLTGFYRYTASIKTLKLKTLDLLRLALQVLIADDHEIVRRGVRSILESRKDLKICGEAANGQDAVLKAA
jgi:hypothetical protein